MMAAWMLYTLLVTLLLAVAGGAMERIARALAIPTRLFWVVVIVAATGLSGASLADKAMATSHAVAPAREHVTAPRVDRSTANPGALPGPTFARERASSVGVGATSALYTRLQRIADLPLDVARWQRFDAILIGLCATLAAAGILVVVASLVRLRRMAKTLAEADIDGCAVLLSHELGPAALGFFRRYVVMPYWVLALAAEERRTILLHEQEHATARDPILVLLGVLALASQPWNLPLWFVVARLRFAVEADCDARVLRRCRCGARRYGALLLQVHERGVTGPVRDRLPVTAFVDSTSHLERRVRRMTDRQPKLRSLSTGVACVVALLVAGSAFTIRVSNAAPAPRTPDATPRALAAVSQDALVAAPAMPEAFDAMPAVEPPWRAALPDLANVERDAVVPAPVRVAAPPVRWQEPGAATHRAAPRAAFAPETLLVRSSNSMWAMKARITVANAAGAGRVVVTDTLGRALPSADTLVVEGPVRVILPDARFQLRVESLSGDLMVTTSAMPARDRSRGRWVSTLLGRSFSVARDSAGEAARFRMDGAGVVASHVVPGSQSPPKGH